MANLVRSSMIGLCAAGLALTAGSAAGQCRVSPGPDVIVGDVNGVANYSPAGALDAISLGTTSCNIGMVWLNWIASTNQHPVIGGTLYKYSTVDGAGRFEQLGRSWLKHGFFALSQNLCCANCSATDGSHLGVGCSDPYTASRNGSQGGLGPRWQVNASTGVYNYPPANPTWSGTTARRLQFVAAEAPNTGTGIRYFGETQYVSPDDAAAHNQNNNASWREMSCSGTATDKNFGFIGNTVRQQSAIQAWQVIDRSVSLSVAQDDGKFIVGSRAHSLGGGMWRYEYAVYNMNSDRSAGGFRVPVPANAVLSNVGFHDVAYLNGDGIPLGGAARNFDGTDWVGGKVGTTVAWNTESFAANSNANAIRWGTTYNFRFDTTVAPRLIGQGTVTLFKPGTAGSVTFTGQVPCMNDFNADGFVNGLDFDAYVDAFEAGDATADTDGDGFVTGVDFDSFVVGFEAGC